MCTKSTWNNWKKPVWVALFWSLQTTVLPAQVTNQQSYWLRFYLQETFAKKWSWHLELDERRLINPDRQLQFITHAHVHRQLGKGTEVSMGGSYSVVNQVMEHRLFQEFHYSKLLGQRMIWANRFRTEQRRIEQDEGLWQWRFRVRYRLQLGYLLGKNWGLKLSDEIMWHTDAFDQNRIYVAIEKKFSKVFSLEIGYLKLYQFRSESAYGDRDILRSTFYLKL
jgi:hypothetical protein